MHLDDDDFNAADNDTDSTDVVDNVADDADETTTDELEVEEDFNLGEDDGEGEEEPEGLLAALRRKLKGDARAKAKLTREVEEYRAKETPVDDVGPAPDVANYDYDSSDPDYLKELAAWSDRRSAYAKSVVKTPSEQIRVEFEGDRARYAEGAESLQYADKDEALANVNDAFTLEQQVTLVQSAVNPAKFAYALDKNPTILEKLQAIKNPIKLSAEIARLEERLTVRNTKKPPAPATTIRGDNAQGNSAKRIDALREKARKTGDYTEYDKARWAAKG